MKERNLNLQRERREEGERGEKREREIPDEERGSVHRDCPLILFKIKGKALGYENTPLQNMNLQYTIWIWIWT
jgi:hypothetical protein